MLSCGAMAATASPWATPGQDSGCGPEGRKPRATAGLSTLCLCWCAVAAATQQWLVVDDDGDSRRFLPPHWMDDDDESSDARAWRAVIRGIQDYGEKDAPLNGDQIRHLIGGRARDLSQRAGAAAR